MGSRRRPPDRRAPHRPHLVPVVVLVVAALVAACSGGSTGSSSSTSRSDATTSSTTGSDRGPDGLEPPRNPFLADSPWPASHRGPYNQASSPLPGPAAASGTPALAEASPTAITVAYGPTGEDGSATVWGSTFTTIVKGVAAADGSIQVVDELSDPPELPAEAGATGSITAAYTLVDADGTFFAARGRRITAYRDATPGDARSPIAKGDSLPMDGVLSPPDSLVALSMTWDGHLVAVSRLGVVLAVDRSLHLVDRTELTGTKEISNSIAVDEDGGIYVTASDRQHRVQWTGTELSTAAKDGAWSAPYDGGGDVPAPGRLGVGSGTTPSLMGTGSDPDQLVIIADGASPMHLVAFWRGAIPKGWKAIGPGRPRRIAAEETITFGDPGATRSITEQSPTIRGYDTLVVSNAYGPPYDTTTGDNPAAAILASDQPAVQPHGMELFRWDPAADRMASVWANQVSCPNGIPSMSAASGLAYCWGARDGSWTLEGVDWATGRSAFSLPLGTGRSWNSFYAATEVGPGGSIASGTFGGIATVVPG